MKYELSTFDKKKVEYIQKNYSVQEVKKRNEIKEESYFEMEREKSNRYKKVLKYKELLDTKKIEEKDIPLEFVDELRKIYEQDIKKLQNKVKNSK